MEPLKNRINEKATIKLVEEHLKSLECISYRIEVTDVSISSGVIRTPNDDTANNPKRDAMLHKIEQIHQTNQETEDYLDWIIQNINQLAPEEKQIIIYKYLYKMNSEELEGMMGMSYRNIQRYMKKAKFKLAKSMKIIIYTIQNKKVS